jgi:hypothetical protein
MVDRHSNSDHPRCMAAWRAALTQLAVAWGSHDIDPSRQYAFCHSSMETYLMTPSLMTVRCDHCRRELGLGVHRYWRMCFCSQNCMTAYQKRLTQETKTKIRHLEISRYSARSGGHPPLWGGIGVCCSFSSPSNCAARLAGAIRAYGLKGTSPSPLCS